MSRLADYENKFEHVKLERDDRGILLVTFHTDGRDLQWNLAAHEDIAGAWDDISRDPDNRVVIVTGAGESFISQGGVFASDQSWVTAESWRHVHRVGRRLVMSHLDIEVPVIAAVNGPATLHSEQVLLCDIIIASSTATFADHAHFVHGVVPGDGVQAIWPMVIGLNRARYLLLTGQVISAETALAWGAVNEVLAPSEVLPRAYELAAVLAAKPTVALTSARMVMTNHLRKLMSENVDFGLMTEGLAGSEFWPTAP